MRIRMNATTNITENGNPEWLKLVHAQVNTLGFGVVQIVVHENRVVQIERTEKVRLDKVASSKSADWSTRGSKNS